MDVNLNNLMKLAYFKKQLRQTEAGLQYLQLVEEAQKNQIFEKDQKTEVHHILPRCLGGLNELENLVRLKVFDHIKAHYLLAKAFGDKKPGLLKAFECMCRGWHISKLSDLDKIEIDNLEEYATLREKGRRVGIKCKASTRKKISEATVGKPKARTKPVSLETRKKLSEAKKGVTFSQEHKDRISKAKKGKPGTFRGCSHSKEARERMSLSHQGLESGFKGKVHSLETKEKMRKSHLGKKLSEEDKKHKSEAQKKRWEKYRNSKKYYLITYSICFNS